MAFKDLCAEIAELFEEHQRHPPIEAWSLMGRCRHYKRMRGECIHCPCPARPGGAQCETCLAKNNAASRAANAVRRAERLKNQPPPPPKTPMKVYQQLCREKKRARGECAHCPLPAFLGSSRCVLCRNKERDRRRATRAAEKRKKHVKEQSR